MGLDQRVQRRERRGGGADLVGERREAELDALAAVALGLAVQRLVLAELLEQDHRQQARAGPAARRRVEGRRRLGDALAVAAGELLPHGLDHLPLPRDHLQRLGDVLAELHDPARAAAAAARRRFDHHPLARQMLGEGLARRAAALEGAHRRLRLRRRLLGGELVLGGGGLELLELQLELVEQPRLALGPRAVEGALELLDLELQRGDHRLGARQHRPRLARPRPPSPPPLRRAPRPPQGRCAGLRSRRSRRSRAEFIAPRQYVGAKSHAPGRITRRRKAATCAAGSASRSPRAGSRAAPPTPPPRHRPASAR